MDCSALDDESLMPLIVAAQPEALGELYSRYGRLVFSLAFHSVGDHGAAEEITQDVFVRVWQHAAQYQASEGKVRTWLLAITRHHAVDHLRRHRARPELRLFEWGDRLPAPGSTGDGLEQEAELALERDRIQAAVSQLPVEQQQVLVLAYFQGFTQSQIAEGLSLPLGTVKTRIRLAMDKLRQALCDEGAEGMR